MNTTYVIDASAWITYFQGGDKRIKDIIDKEHVITTVIALAELSDVLHRERAERVDETLAFVRRRALPYPLTMKSAADAGRIKQELRKRRPKAGLADACQLAIARERKAVLVTTDTDFEGERDVLFLAA